MKKGFFSHQLCYRHSLLDKHIIYLTADNRVEGVEPFRHEVAMTIFCQGVVMAVSLDFVTREAEFCQELYRQLADHSSLTVGEAILQNNSYAQCRVGDDYPCLLYAITSVDWSTGRLSGDKVELTKVV